MIKFILVSVLISYAVASSTDVVIKGFSEALDKLDIPADRKAKYQTGLESARPCIDPLTKDAEPERIADYIKKLTPVVAECSKTISSLPADQVKERKEAFSKCLKEKVHGDDSQFDDKQKDILPKIKACVLEAMKE